VVEFVVDTLGRVEREIRVVEASRPELGEPARATIRPARFRPGHVKGRKVRVMMTLRFHFAPPRS
jgi:TonB family protein